MNATSAAVIIGTVALISLTVTVVLVASSFRQALHNVTRFAERLDARHQGHLDTVLDRLMTIKWEDYVAVRSTDEEIDGGFYPPLRDGAEDTAVLGVEGPKWGHLSKVAERLRLDEEETAIINEDFDEEGSPRK